MPARDYQPVTCGRNHKTTRNLLLKAKRVAATNIEYVAFRKTRA
jgi:hypothetical protein